MHIVYILKIMTAQARMSYRYFNEQIWETVRVILTTECGPWYEDDTRKYVKMLITWERSVT